jgi:hypothetical protein
MLLLILVFLHSTTITELSDYIVHFSNGADGMLRVSENGSSLVSSLCSWEDPCLSVVQACKKEIDLHHSSSVLENRVL